MQNYFGALYFGEFKPHSFSTQVLPNQQSISSGEKMWYGPHLVAAFAACAILESWRH